SGMGTLRLVYAGGQGFRPICPDPADNAGSRDRRRGVVGRDARATNEAGRPGLDRRRAERHRTLVAGETAQGDDGRTGEVSLTPLGQLKGRLSMFQRLFIATLSLGTASAVIGQSLPEMRMPPAEMRASATDDNQIGSARLPGVPTSKAPAWRGSIRERNLVY